MDKVEGLGVGVSVDKSGELKISMGSIQAPGMDVLRSNGSCGYN